MNYEKKVSVIICTYNHADFIQNAIDSVLDQSMELSEYEVLVINDGCTDHTNQVLEKYGQLIKVIENQENRGLIYSCNRGIREAQGKYIIRVDSDDSIDRNTLLFESAILDSNDNIGCVYSDRFEIDCSSGDQKRISLEPFNLFSTIACGIMFRKCYLEEIGGYDDLFFEEYDLLLRYLAKYTGYYIKIPFYHYYFHGNNMMLNQEKIIKGKKELADKWGLSELEKWGYNERLFSS